jgi:hypothetical protein
MNRRQALLATLLTPLLALFGATPAGAFWDTAIAPSGKVATEARNATDFRGVSMAVPGTLVVRQGEPAAVSVEADDNLLPEIETVVEGGILKIRYKRKVDVSGRPTIRLLVTGPVIESLAVSGSGDILSESIRANALELAVSGSGDVRIARAETQSLKLSIAGSGDVKVAGRTGEVTAKIAGSGDISAGRLESARATVSIAGSGDVTLWVRESLAVKIAGSGDVHYHGDPSVTKKIAGSGSVTRLGAAP